MKTIKILAVIVILFLASFANEVKAQELGGAYYYGYAVSTDDDRIYVTPVMYSSCGFRWGSSPLTEIRDQFIEYMRSEYRNLDNYVISAGFENIEFTSTNDEKEIKAKYAKKRAVSSRRQLMGNYKNVVKITDFEYLCE